MGRSLVLPQRPYTFAQTNLSRSFFARDKATTHPGLSTAHPQSDDVQLAQRSEPQRSHLLQALYNIVAWSSDNRNAGKKGVGQCRSPLIGRGRVRHDIAAASFSFSPSLASSSSAVVPRCRITLTCSGSSRSATGRCSGKHWASSGGSSRLLQRPHFSFCTDRSWH